MFKLQPEPRRTSLSLLGSFLFHGLLFTFLILWKPEVSQIFQEEKPKTVYLAKRVPSLKVPLPTPTRRLIPKKRQQTQPIGPKEYDTTLTAEEGLRARKGWAGRPYP